MSDPERPQHDLAIALHYDGDNAPRVTAKGRGELADRILEIAEANDVPLQEDALLAGVLCQIPLGEEIPENLYRAVAEVIAYAYLVSGRVPDGFQE